MRTSVCITTLRQTSFPKHHTQTTHTLPIMASRLAVVVATVVPVKQLVCPCLQCVLLYRYQPPLPGCVATGAIAEKYLKTAYGIEIITFVSSIGKVHLLSSALNPNSNNNDEAQDPLSDKFHQSPMQKSTSTTHCPHHCQENGPGTCTHPTEPSMDSFTLQPQCMCTQWHPPQHPGEQGMEA
jgi:hypothetical protein